MALSAADVARVLASALAGEEELLSAHEDGSDALSLVLFSTLQRDAWLIAPRTQDARCLVWRGQPLVKDTSVPLQGEQGWDGPYVLAGEFFSVATNHPSIGVRYIGGYPIDQLRALSRA